jgi:hypothetical protein
MTPAVAVLACCQGGGSQQPSGSTCCAAQPAAVETAPLAAGETSARAVMAVELLALDLSTCDRCAGTDSAIEAAVTDLRPALAQAGVALRFRKTVVQTAEQATALRFQSSPTIRINGRDVPIELRESRCGDCTTLCGGAASTDCRVWVWRGREYTEAPKGLIVDAILRAYPQAGEQPQPAREGFVLPENLRGFFAAKRERPASADARASSSAQPSGDTQACCAAGEKATCCGADQPTGKGPCGCKPR